MGVWVGAEGRRSTRPGSPRPSLLPPSLPPSFPSLTSCILCSSKMRSGIPSAIRVSAAFVLEALGEGKEGGGEGRKEGRKAGTGEWGVWHGLRLTKLRDAGRQT